jgi:hypothetical protein
MTVPHPAEHSTRPVWGIPDPAIWRALGAFGAVLTLLGFLDVGSLWVPTLPDSPAGVFGRVSTFFDQLPQVAIGLTLLVTGAVARARRLTARGLALACVAVSVVLWLAAFLYLDALPYIFQVRAEPPVRLHVQKMTIKTGVQALVYPLFLILLAWGAWGATDPQEG